MNWIRVVELYVAGHVAVGATVGALSGCYDAVEVAKGRPFDPFCVPRVAFFTAGGGIIGVGLGIITAGTAPIAYSAGLYLLWNDRTRKSRRGK